MTSHRRLICALACTAAALAVSAVAGCGGGDAETLSRAEFLSQGNEICAAGARRIAAHAPAARPGRPPSGAEAQAFFSFLTTETERQIDELAALKPPEDLRADIDRLLADGRAGLETVQAQGAETFFADEEDPFAAVNVMARRIGLTACAS